MNKSFSTYNFLPKFKNTRFSEGGKRFSNSNSNFLFSIITVVLNREQSLQETITSISKQTCKDFEYIIIDGGSKDGTLNIIKDNSNLIDYWVSEEDQGLYDAFNKGLSLAKGEYIRIVNSEDIYTPEAFSVIKKYILQNKSTDFIFGSVKKHWGCFARI